MVVRQIGLGVALALLLVGCHPATVAELDARDRDNTLIRRAHDCEQIGDMQGAIRLYGQALLDYPKLASAHLNLALLLQDVSKDYMGAIYHYRQYEMLRTDTEKKALVQERIRISQQLLIAQMLNSGDVTVSQEQKKLVAEVERLNQRLSQTEGEKAALLEQRDKLEQQIADQKTEMDRLRRLVDRLQLPTGDEGGRGHSALPRLEPGVTPATQPSPTTSTPPGTLLPLRSADRTATASRTTQPTAAIPDNATRAPAGTMRTYVVQPGDSLFRIAERVYGDSMQWKKVRDANTDRIDLEGRLHAGQVLLIP